MDWPASQLHITYQKAVIDHIQYNYSTARIYFEFNHRFWLSQTQKTAMTITDNPTVWIEDHTDYLETASAVLEVHASGKIGKSFQTDVDAVNLAKNELINVWRAYYGWFDMID